MLGKIPEQLRRLSVVLAIIFAGVLAARYLVLPSSLIDRRLHRESTTRAEIAKPVFFAGGTVCGDCHEDQAKKKKAGYHKNLSCETCHGPAAAHTEDLAAKPFVPKERSFCLRCHDYDLSRPTGFPQINPVIHNPRKSCAACHNPHDPVPPQVPKECAACHGQIERIKTVSPHALIGCTTCHAAQVQHKIAPRSVKPTKPETREFCGKCHGKESIRKDAPKVDLVAHGERFLCWECHYPHLPERAR
jgi:predicted CXXCH cytochrome family protein